MCLTTGTAGQGVNQALEDAVELAQAINKGGLTPDSLRAYESSRIPRVQEIMAAEMVCHHSHSVSACTHLQSALFSWCAQLPDVANDDML